MNRIQEKQLIADFIENAVHVDELEEGAFKSTAKELEALFTTGVAMLRLFPDDEIQALACYAWDVIGQKHVLTAVGLPVRSLSLTIGVQGGVLQKIIHIPRAWAKNYQKDPIHETGGLVFVCSQAVDAFNNHLTDARERALAYEGRFLRLMGIPNPTAYQQRVMGSPPVSTFAYERKTILVEL